RTGRLRTPPSTLPLHDALPIWSWRFYDHVRTDSSAPARSSQIGTRTMVLAHDGADLAAAWQTIAEIGDAAALAEAVDDAFPGSRSEEHTLNSSHVKISYAAFCL